MSRGDSSGVNLDVVKLEIIGQLGMYWEGVLGPRLAGLSDEEYLWEPVAGCWTVRAVGDRWLADTAPVPPDAAPVTTIAWRLSHITTLLVGHSSMHFGDRTFDMSTTLATPTAGDAITMVTMGVGQWLAHLENVVPAQFCQPVERPSVGLSDYPFARVALNVNKEVIHHGAEIGALRDLYRQRDHPGWIATVE